MTKLKIRKFSSEGIPSTPQQSVKPLCTIETNESVRGGLGTKRTNMTSILLPGNSGDFENMTFIWHRFLLPDVTCVTWGGDGGGSRHINPSPPCLPRTPQADTLNYPQISTDFPTMCVFHIWVAYGSWRRIRYWMDGYHVAARIFFVFMIVRVWRC